MPKFQKGNQASKGVSAGKTGRKSQYQEHIDAQWHALAWKGLDEKGKPIDVQKLLDRISAGKTYGVRDMYLLRALKGDPRILAKFGDKLLPDLTVLMNPDGTNIIQPDLVGEGRKRSAKYHQSNAKP